MSISISDIDNYIILSLNNLWISINHKNHTFIYSEVIFDYPRHPLISLKIKFIHNLYIIYLQFFKSPIHPPLGVL